MTTEETQALVDRLRIERMNTTEWACRMYRKSVSPESVDHRQVIKRADAALADALAALTALARDLAAEVDKAVELARLLATARQERDAALARERQWTDIAASNAVRKDAAVRAAEDERDAAKAKLAKYIAEFEKTRTP